MPASELIFGVVVRVDVDTAKADEQVVEVDADVPVRLQRCAQRILDNLGLLDLLGRGQDVVVGLRDRDVELVEDVLAVLQVLHVDEQRDRHDLAVDLDQLVRLELLAVLGDEIVERPDRLLRQQRNDGAVVHVFDLIERRVRGEGGGALAADFLIELGGEIAAFLHRLGDHLPRRERGEVSLDRDRVLVGAGGLGRRRRQQQGREYQCCFAMHFHSSCWRCRARSLGFAPGFRDSARLKFCRSKRIDRRHPFTAPCVSPPTRWRWKTRTSRNSGAVIDTAAAIACS